MWIPGVNVIISPIFAWWAIYDFEDYDWTRWDRVVGRDILITREEFDLEMYLKYYHFWSDEIEYYDDGYDLYRADL